ncbi:YybH family protein [Kordiimonas aquimaris]|uniref:YybH family protein n=1 Tax=Kordiimonas aquimaris TaxID=707591 RepID=UPI0021D01C72|nr:nuclear transport factor 2 family protein [Kordiimonas aquimaris]
MKAHILRLIMFTAMLFAGTTVMQTHASNDNQEEVVRGLMSSWLAAYNTKDIDALMSLYSDKIYYANNGNNLVRDTQTIRQNYSHQFDSGSKTTIDFAEELITVGEKLAHIAGKYRVNIPQADGSKQNAYGRVLLIFEKQDEQWKLIVDFDNTGRDAALGPFND